MTAIPVVLVLLAYAALTSVIAPAVLSRRPWHIRRPVLVLALWHGAGLTALLSVGAALVIATASIISATRAAGRWPDGPWGVAATVTAWGALGVVAGVGAVMKQQSETVLCSARHLDAEVHALVHVAGYRAELRDGVTVHFVESARMFACASPGRHPLIVVSSALTHALTAQQLDAVIEHEHAHLRGKHGLALRIAELATTWWPRMAATSALRRVTALTVELVADDRAAARYGSQTLAAALLRIAEADGDQGMVLRARRLLALA